MRGSLSGRFIDPNTITVSRIEELLKGITIHGDCWVHSQKHHTGYTYAKINTVRHSIHRIFKVATTGKTIPTGFVCDHLCKKRACVNPKHIEIVTQSVNSSRGNAGVTFKSNPEYARQMQILTVKSKLLKKRKTMNHTQLKCKKNNLLKKEG